MTRDRRLQGNSARQLIDGLAKITDPGPPGHFWREIGHVDAGVGFELGGDALRRTVSACWRAYTRPLRRRELEYWLLAGGERYDPDRMVISLGLWWPAPEKGFSGDEFSGCGG